MPPKIHQQGHLDGLCGCYAITNGVAIAVSTLKPRPPFRSRRLFQAILEALDQSGVLHGVICHGMNSAVHHDCLKAAKAFMASHHHLTLTTARPWWGKLRIDRRKAFASVRDHLSKPGTSALLQFETASYGHWTVIAAINDDKIFLADSIGLKWRSIDGMHFNRQWDQKRRGSHVSSTSLILLTVRHR